MDLYLIRHAVAVESADWKGSDADRPLTEEGIARFREAARGLAAIGVAPDRILSSPYRRARQTAEIVRKICAPKMEVRIEEALACGGTPAAVIKGLSVEEAPSVALVGHEPNLGELASRLLSGRDRIACPFKKGAVMALSFSESPSPGGGRLLWSLTPKILGMIN